MKHLFTISETMFVISTIVEPGDNVPQFIEMITNEFRDYGCSVSQNTGLRTKEGKDTLFNVYVTLKPNQVEQFEIDLNNFLEDYFKDNFWLALKKEEDDEDTN